MKNYLIILLLFGGHYVSAQDFAYSTVWKGSTPSAVILNDYNRDGTTEFIVVVHMPDNITAVLSVQADTPVPDTLVQVPGALSQLAIDDFNGDNRSDLVFYSDETSAIMAHYADGLIDQLLPADSIHSLEVKRSARGLPVLVVSRWLDSQILNQVLYYQDGEWQSRDLAGSFSPLDESVILPDSTGGSLVFGRHGTNIHRYTDFASDSLAGSASHLDRSYINAPGIYLGGPDSTGTMFSIIHEQSGVLDLSASMPDQVVETIIADFTSDGITDILYSTAESKLALLVNLWGPDSLIRQTLDMRLYGLTYGDVDGDGDLDVAGLSPDSAVVIYAENLAITKNFGPMPVNKHVAFAFRDHVILAWEPTIDDHTEQDKITYDVALGTGNFSTDILPSTFHLDSATRMRWEWGNVGHTTTLEMHDLESGSYWYGLQSIDNARIALTDLVDCPYPVNTDQLCNGLPIACGSFSKCDEFTYTELPSCGGLVTINESAESGWYSTRTGFLGFTHSLQVTALEGDTIFSVPIGTFECEKQKAYTFSNSPVSDPAEVHACPGEVTELSIPLSPDSVSWLINNEIVGRGKQLSHVFDSTTVVVAVSSFGTCSKTDYFDVVVATPQVRITPDSASILQGETLLMQADGALTYAWEPSGSIRENNGNQVIVAPEVTTRYTVSGTDVYGCMGSDSAVVNVIRQAFIPNLFTPNQDSNNDLLLIYGLGQTSSFEFVVTNRNGSIVFQSEDAAEMESTGWDGTNKGKELPDGVYYWKIGGAFADGKQILLNGTKEGVVHLLR